MFFQLTAGPMKTISWQMCLVSETECNYFEARAYSSMGKGRPAYTKSLSQSSML